MAKLPLEVTNLPLKVEKLVPGGQGLITVDYNIKTIAKGVVNLDDLTDREKALLPAGKKGFIWNALPGEIITKYTIIKSKTHYFEAIAKEYENPSKYRIAPKDSCFLSTSPWQILAYDEELKLKRELLLETFRQAGLAEQLPAAKIQLVQTDGKDYFYRNKMEYSLYYDLGESKIKLAQHQRGSHRKIPLETSSIERPEIFQKATEIVDELNRNGEEARRYQSLLLRCDQNGEVSGGLFENHQPHPVFKNLSDAILDQTYSYSPNGFFQINLPVYEMALRKIAQHIKTPRVLDLYAGVGTIGLSVARDRDLTLVECNKFAYQELTENCQQILKARAITGTGNLNETTTTNGLVKVAGDTIRPILANSEDALDYITPDQTVIVDPPRAGCDQKLLQKFLEVQPDTIIYLSCNPATQARDLAILTGVAGLPQDSTTNAGAPKRPQGQAKTTNFYKIESVTPYNFFPRTPHLENLVILKSSRNLL